MEYKLDSFILSKHFYKSFFDSCVYKKSIFAIVYILVLLYLDDILIALTDKIEISKLKVALCKEFEMRNLREAKKILSMELTKDCSRGIIHITQVE